jgi:hypothetical protein
MFYRGRLLGMTIMFDDKKAMKEHPGVKAFSRVLDIKLLTAYTYYNYTPRQIPSMIFLK